MKQVAPLQPMEDHIMPQQMELPWGKLKPMERSSCRSMVSGRNYGLWWTHAWSSLFLMDHTPLKGPTLEQLLKTCSPWETHTGTVEGQEPHGELW